MAQRSVRLDGLDTTVVGTLRSPSISSDVMSNSTRSFNNAVPAANPPPAYIAASGASDLISSELDRAVVVSSQALDLVNEFLDQVLLNILATAKSVSLGSLRAAVPSVLKPRLGKAAIRAAEEDLKEYLEEDEEVELNTKKGVVDSKNAFDTELAWKLARLRCMVYAQLGDLEEEDEEEWLERDQLLQQVETRRDTHGDIALGPTAAIFLASVVEYLGEQALHYAAQHAQKRSNMARAQDSADKEGTNRTLTPKTDEIVLEGKDMNHVGRDSPLSRLWRSWRRNTRDGGTRAFSPDTTTSFGFRTPSHSRSGSLVPGIEQIAEEQRGESVVEHSPSQIPLPLGDNDIDEIEVPGLAPLLSDTEEDDDDYEFIEHDERRPSSMVFMPGTFPEVVSETPPDMGDAEQPSTTFLRPQFTRQRSMSSPAPKKQHYAMWKTYVAREVDPVDETTDEALSRDTVDEEAAESDVTDSAEVYEDVPEQIEHSPTSAESTHSDQSPTSPSQASRRGRSSPREPGSPNKRDGMVGGALAAAIGAAGAAGAAALRDDQEKNSVAQERESAPSSQKRTVAEEMLGEHDAVKPPRDAATGSSITNFSDFDSMYVPMQMPTESERRSMPPIPLNKIRPPHKATASQGSLSAQAVALSRKPLPAEPDQIGETEVPAQEPVSRTGRQKAEQQHHERDELSTKDDAQAGTDTATSSQSRQRPDSPVSPIPTSDDRPLTAESTISEQDVGDVPGPRDALHSNPVHVQPVSQASGYSLHSKSSSSSSRILGFTRDAAGKPQTISQQHAAGGMSENARAAHSSTPTQTSRDNRPSTASSSTSRVTGKPSAPLYGAAVTTKKSDEIDADKKKSLEILIRSNETLHYTLTPANVMQPNDSATVNTRRTETQDMADFLRNTGPSESSSHHSGQGSQYSNNMMDPTFSRNTSMRSPVGGRTLQSQSVSQYGSSPARMRGALGEARDARTERNSTMRDLADYARNTGPMNESQLPQPLSPRFPQSGSSRAPARPQVKPPVSTKPKNRIKLEARDARPSRTADNADLIDFIREGPPRTVGDHRIDRKIAPFRTTMDSEDFNSLGPQVGRESPIANSAVSTNDGRPINGVSNGYQSRSQTSRQFEDDGMPQRTRRRIKDPYAIDDSDDEDLFDGISRPQQGKNEESLIDFLRNTGPPPGAAAQPILAARPGNGKFANSAGIIAADKARDPSPHLTQSGSKIDKYRPTQVTHASHIDRNRVKPNLEAREARPRRNDTSELAEYLKFSGPPPSAEYQPRPFDTVQTRNLQQKDDSGLMRMFTKRKAK